eukprot:scaffold957_cov322-Pavlova_lutheri.AAC.9
MAGADALALYHVLEQLSLSPLLRYFDIFHARGFNLSVAISFANSMLYILRLARRLWFLRRPGSFFGPFHFYFALPSFSLPFASIPARAHCPLLDSIRLPSFLF